MTLEQIAERSKNASIHRPLYIYFNYKTQEIEIEPNKNNFRLTGLIRENSTTEIKRAVARFLNM